jgi:hypothetical protein
MCAQGEASHACCEGTECGCEGLRIVLADLPRLIDEAFGLLPVRRRPQTIVLLSNRTIAGNIRGRGHCTSGRSGSHCVFGIDGRARGGAGAPYWRSGWRHLSPYWRSGWPC